MHAIDYAHKLIRFDSTSRNSNLEVSDYCESVLRELGCETERIEYSDAGVLKVNVLARKGEGARGLAYFAHTDVVPADQWSLTEHGPFEPTVREGRLYGRGSTDMKGSLACMLAALHTLTSASFEAPLFISCSSDEEIDHRGAIEIAARSKFFQELVAGKACGVVGEPTGLDVVYAHKGGCQIFVTSRGIAAHSSTREGKNANLAMIPFLTKLRELYLETEQNRDWWDTEFDPATVCMNIGINDHNPALNITAPRSVCTIGMRPMPGTEIDLLVGRVRALAEECSLDFKVRTSNPPFRRDPAGAFVRRCQQLASGFIPRTVAYGSEAGNFPQIEDLVVLGPGDISQAHKDDEWVSLEQLERGQDVYQRLIRSCCLGHEESAAGA